MAERQLKVEVKVVPLSTLKPRAVNPRRIMDKNFMRLKKSLNDFGQVINLVVNKEGEILSGNMRYRAMLELGWSDVSVLEIDTTLADEDAINIILNSKRARGYFVVDKYQQIVIDNSSIFQELGIDVSEFVVDNEPLGDITDIGINFLDDEELENKAEVNKNRVEDNLVTVGNISLRISNAEYRALAQECELKGYNPAKVLVSGLIEYGQN